MKTKSEARLQQECVQWFRKNFYKKGIIFSVPNERKDYLEIKPLLQTGLLSGASDLIVVMKGVVLFVELKTPTGTQGKKQKQFQDNVEAFGFDYCLIRDLESFKKIFK